MSIEKVLSLDISSKTGWSLILSGPGSISLEKYGKIEQSHAPETPYPGNYVDWATLCHRQIAELVDEYKPDILVIEETSRGSKNAHSQKILEWIHFLVAKSIKESGIKSVYIMSEQWRREVGCKMTKDEAKHNKEVRDYKKKNKTSIAYNKDGKRVGVIGRKHVNIRVANEVFGNSLKELLRKKDEDTADSLLLGYAYHLRRQKILEMEKKYG